MPPRLGEGQVRVGHATAQSVHVGVAERAGDAARELATLGGESDQSHPRAHFHAAPRRCTSTIEK